MLCKCVCGLFWGVELCMWFVYVLWSVEEGVSVLCIVLYDWMCVMYVVGVL